MVSVGVDVISSKGVGGGVVIIVYPIHPMMPSASSTARRTGNPTAISYHDRGKVAGKRMGPKNAVK